MRIQHNIMAMSAYRNYTNNVSAMKKNLEKLSSGYKINRAGDDAAGLAISEKMRAQITGLETAQKNAKDGISLVQTAEGALTEVHDMLNRMVELATQSANGTYDNTTDRAQMQKEVNQLLDEINRIADSSNFNGINLLDGTLGLNKDAFSFSEAALVEANDGSIDISSLVAKEADGSPKVHLETQSVTAAAPSATIDLGDFAIDGNKTGDKVTITIAGKDYEITSAADDDLDSATKVATALKAAIAASNQGVKSGDGAHDATAANNDAIRIGNAAYTVGGTGSTITLTYAGRYDSATGNTFTAETAYTGTADQAKDINNELGFDVNVKSVTTTDGTRQGDVIHKATNVGHAKAEVLAAKAGIDIKLTADLIKEGGSLKIDGKEFKFKVDANSTLTGAGVIDVSAAKTDEERIHMAADLLSKEAEFNGAGDDTTRTWKIGVSGDGTTIHIDQTTASATGKELNSYDKLVGVIEAKGVATTAKNVGTKITVTDAEVKEGNTLTIGEGDNAKKYVFSDEKTGTDGNITYVAIKGGAGKNLAAAISGSEYDAATNTVTVRAATANDKAPVVLGKGLTLQIGDTADSYNQLNVAVQDMHAGSLGIKDLKINTEELAQAATDKIKAAINMVSDVRGTLGATQNRLDHTINNLSVMTENIQDAESTIRDVDVAEEMMAYTKNNILIQSAQAMLAQANQVPQGVLQLLQ